MAQDGSWVSRRGVLAGMGAASVVLAAEEPARSQAGRFPATDATFLFSNDIHACRTAKGLSPGCAAQGKTDANLIRHIAALNRISEARWPAEIGGFPTGLASAGAVIARPLGLVLGGDLTDDGGGQTALPEEGAQLVQFSQRYQKGEGEWSVHMPGYLGLGNHDLDQDGLPPRTDWYRREMRDYVEMNHRSWVFFRPQVPVQT